jgi:hypothetical protein
MPDNLFLHLLLVHMERLLLRYITIRVLDVKSNMEWIRFTLRSEWLLRVQWVTESRLGVENIKFEGCE